jgi:hypothetical protein
MKNTIFQDNESAIKMEKNGRNSCTGNSQHIEIWSSGYFNSGWSSYFYSRQSRW